jgi:hypothetical protein
MAVLLAEALKPCMSVQVIRPSAGGPSGDLSVDLRHLAFLFSHRGTDMEFGLCISCSHSCAAFTLDHSASCSSILLTRGNMPLGEFFNNTAHSKNIPRHRLLLTLLATSATKQERAPAQQSEALAECCQGTIRPVPYNARKRQRPTNTIRRRVVENSRGLTRFA